MPRRALCTYVSASISYRRKEWQALFCACGAGSAGGRAGGQHSAHSPVPDTAQHQGGRVLKDRRPLWVHRTSTEKESGLRSHAPARVLATDQAERPEDGAQKVKADGNCVAGGTH